MGLKKIAIRFMKYSLWGLAIIVGLNATSIPIAYLANRAITPKSNTIVFTGENNLKDYGLPSLPVWLTDFLMYTPITLQQTFGGNRVYWCSNPDLEKFVEELKNSEYSNVILVGHGKKDRFSLRDGEVFADTLAKQDISLRTGEFYQYTCGGYGDGRKTLREVLFTDEAKSKTFEGILWPHTSYISSWTGIPNN